MMRQKVNGVLLNFAATIDDWASARQITKENVGPSWQDFEDASDRLSKA